MPRPPTLDAERVAALAELASRLDGGSEHDDQPLVDQFNQLAGTDLDFASFQGVYGAEEHATFVERLLTAGATEADPTLDRAGLVDLIQAVLDDVTDDRRLTHAAVLIEKTYGEPSFTDAIFWPDVFFGHGDVQRVHTAEEIADAVLERRAERATRGPILL